MSEKEISEKKWTKEHEKLFVEWADKALCYKWLHSKCNLKYNLNRFERPHLHLSWFHPSYTG